MRDAVMRLLTDVERTERLIEERIEREREAMRDPDREALWWAKRLEEIDVERKQSQKMAARGLMDLDVLDELLDELEEERRTAHKELEAARGLKGRIESWRTTVGSCWHCTRATLRSTLRPSHPKSAVVFTLRSD